MLKNIFTKWLIFVSACSFIDGKPLNVLFIFTDDHAYQAISAYGSNRNKTPNIDRIAQDGMLFNRAFVTNSICVPSRAVILTGKHRIVIMLFKTKKDIYMYNLWSPLRRTEYNDIKKNYRAMVWSSISI